MTSERAQRVFTKRAAALPFFAWSFERLSAAQSRRCAGGHGCSPFPLREQASGIAQVGDAVTQMDQMTQQDVAQVEQSAAAADSLNVQARDLVSAVSNFRLAEA